MAEPKAYEPEKLTSGVTWKWKKTVSDYPASEWTLTYYLRKDGAAATSFSATADGDTHLVTVAAATTAGYAAGVYDGHPMGGVSRFSAWPSAVYSLTQAGVPNQSCISLVKGATTSLDSGMWPRSWVEIIQVSSAARRRLRAAWWAGFWEAARLRIS